MQTSGTQQHFVYDETNITNPLVSTTHSSSTSRVRSPLLIENPLSPSLTQGLPLQNSLNSTNSTNIENLYHPESENGIRTKDAAEKMSRELRADKERSLHLKIVSENTLDYTKEDELYNIATGVITSDLMHEEKSIEILNILKDAHDRRTNRFTTGDNDLVTISGHFRINLATILNEPVDVDTILSYLLDGGQNSLQLIFRYLFETWGLDNLSRLKALMIPFGITVLTALNHSFAPLWKVIVEYMRNRYNRRNEPFFFPRVLNTTLHSFYDRCIRITIRWNNSYLSRLGLFIRPYLTNEQVIPVIEGAAQNRINEIETEAKRRHDETLRIARNASRIADEDSFFTITVQNVEDNLKLIFGPMYDRISYPFRLIRGTFRLLYNALNFSSIFSWLITGAVIIGPFAFIHFGSSILLGFSPILAAFSGGRRLINYFIEGYFPTTAPRITTTTRPIVPITPLPLTLIQQILDFIVDRLEKTANAIKDINKNKKN